MSEGDKWELYIPSDLAYGPSGPESIGPNQVLVFTGTRVLACFFIIIIFFLATLNPIKHLREGS
jgi:hypothetical protein